MLVSEKHLARVTGEKRFHGSALTWHPRTRHVAARGRPAAGVRRGEPATGEVLGGGRLSKQLHRQPEGIAVAPDLTLLISDEAAGRAATITAYAYRP